VLPGESATEFATLEAALIEELAPEGALQSVLAQRVVLRYRGGTLAELWRALRTLKALQAEQAARLEPVVAPAPPALPEPRENADRTRKPPKSL
jgi:hypothetical protein